MPPQKVTPRHLARGAYLYLRQPTLHEVAFNTESSARQYALRQRALAMGWQLDQIQVIDCDKGLSGSSAADREGFQKLVAEVGMGRAGIVLGLEVSRLARYSADWHFLCTTSRDGVIVSVAGRWQAKEPRCSRGVASLLMTWRRDTSRPATSPRQFISGASASRPRTFTSMVSRRGNWAGSTRSMGQAYAGVLVGRGAAVGAAVGAGEGAEGDGALAEVGLELLPLSRGRLPVLLGWPTPAPTIDVHGLGGEDPVEAVGGEP